MGAALKKVCNRKKKSLSGFGDEVDLLFEIVPTFLLIWRQAWLCVRREEEWDPQSHGPSFYNLLL